MCKNNYIYSNPTRKCIKLFKSLIFSINFSKKYEEFLNSIKENEIYIFIKLSNQIKTGFNSKILFIIFVLSKSGIIEK